MPIEPSREWREANGPTYTDELLPAPDGWEWTTRPRWYARRDVDRGILSLTTERRALGPLASDLAALREWAIQYDVQIDNNQNGRITIGGMLWNTPRRISVSPHFAFVNSMAYQESVCPYPECEAMVNCTMLACSACNRDLKCETCRLAFIVPTSYTYQNHTDPHRMGCINCTRRCREPMCQSSIPNSWRYCTEHGDHWECYECDTVSDITVHTPNMIQEQHYCNTCASRICRRCEAVCDTMSEDGSNCVECYGVINAFKYESPEVVALTPEQWRMVSTPERPYRLVSIETEFDRGTGTVSHCGNDLAYALGTQGLSPYSEMMRYHSGNHSQPCHVESDSSVSGGGELIFNRLRLDEEEDTLHTVAILETIQGKLQDNTLRFSARCGTHVHIDMHGYTVSDARNKVTLYSYLEDVIYRLGSAGFGDHRSILSGNHYAMPIRKDKWGDVKKFGMQFLRRADHTDSLNLQHFYSSMRNCKCGAMEFGRMEDCECVRQKCTAEWRVFNGTGDPRKLHAYVALVQALTAWCQDRDIDVDEFDALAFEPNIDFTKELGEAHHNLIGAWAERLTWMFSNLPFSMEEVASLLYCIRNSPLHHVGPEFIAGLALLAANREPEDRNITAPMVSGRDAIVPESRFNRHGNCRNCGEPQPYCECDWDAEYGDDYSEEF